MKKLQPIVVLLSCLIILVSISACNSSTGQLTASKSTENKTLLKSDQPSANQTIGQSIKLAMGERERTYVLHIPSNHESNKPIPLVIMFHGGGGNAAETMKETNWHMKADKEGFFVVCPEGTPRDLNQPRAMRTNPQVWNDGGGRFVWANEVDDVGFAGAIIDDMAKRYAIDKKRIYVTGFSNGASMAFRVGAELSARIAAIAPICGGLRYENANPARPVSCLFIRGTADPLNPLDGGYIKSPFTGGQGPYQPSLQDSVIKWASLIGCSTTPDTFLDNNGVKGVVYSGGKGNSEVVFYTIEDMGHTWPGGRGGWPQELVGKSTDKLNATDVLWSFFQKHPLE